MLSKINPWFVASGVFFVLAAAVILTGCSALQDTGEALSDLLPATQGDLEAVEEGAGAVIRGVSTGNTAEVIRGGVLAFLGAVSFVVGLSRRRRKEQIEAEKARKKGEKIAKALDAAGKPVSA